VYRIDKDGTETSLIPDDKGLITIQGFNTNPYILTEIKTEMGKNLLESPITIQFVPTSNDNGVLKLVNVSMVNGGKTISIEINPENEDKPNMIAIDVTNNETVMLHTGGKGTYWYYIVSGILVLLALGCIIFIKKKHTKND
jgi:LPXTG-motif cell wall-anchored protein